MDAALPRADSLLVRDDRIAVVGPERAVTSEASRHARRIDLEGRAVLPGFNDNHVHTAIGGDHLRTPGVGGLGPQEITDKLSALHAGIAPGLLITAHGWDYPSCPQPHRSLLDAVFPQNPVILYQIGGHGMWVNTQTLRKMRIDRHTPDPPEGSILHDPDGEPTGILREMHSHPYLRRLFMRLHSNPSTVAVNLDRMMEEYPRHGITSVQDNTWFLPVLRELIARRRLGRLPVRFSCWSYGQVPPVLQPLQWLAALQSYDELWVRRGPYKYFLDGTFSTRTGWLTEPYADEAGNSGKGKDSGAIRRQFLARRVRRRQAVACHAIGDRAVKEFLDAVEGLQERHPWTRELRLRVEHAQLIREEDIPRLRRLGVLVAAQPHALGTPEKDVDLLGPLRADRAYPYRWLLDEGVALSFGSDFPGEPTLNPLHAVKMAVSRQGPQRIGVEEALRCYTLGSAYAEGSEELKGSLTAGKRADLTILSDDPLRTLDGVSVETTMVGGVVTYDAGTGGSSSRSSAATGRPK